MQPFGKQSTYELLMSAPPLLLWALERCWSREEAASKGYELDSNENSAWLVMDGTAKVTQNGHTWVAGSGQWMFPKPGRRVQAFEGPFRFLSVTVRWTWPGGRHLFDEGLTLVRDASELPWLEPVGRAVSEVARQVAPGVPYYLGQGEMPIAAAAELFAAGGRWAAAFARAMKESGVQAEVGTTIDPRVSRMILMIREAIGEVTLDRSRIASALDLSPKQLDRLFKEGTGVSPVEFHAAIRADHARQRLLEPGARVKEVAFDLGFGDLAPFSKWFARRWGCSPREYRDRFK